MPHALLRACVLAVSTAVLMIVGATSASAHDQLIDSSPSVDQHLDAAPTQIRLEYSAEIMDVGAAVILADAAGTDWTSGDPVLDGPTVTVPVDPELPDGAYTVRWRVVSSDGHAISGSIPFQVGVVTASPAPASTPTPTEASTAAGSTTTPRTESAFPWRTVGIAAAGAVLAGGLYALVLVLRRRSS